MTESGGAAIDIGRAAAASRVVATGGRSSAAARRGERLGERADFGQRLSALLFDVLLFLIAVMGSTFLISSVTQKSIVSSNLTLGVFYTLALALFAANFVLLAGRTGQTVGKRIVGIRVVTEDGAPAGYTTLLLRHTVGYALSALAGFLGFLWAVWDPKHQAWHDKIARTVVVLAR